MRWLGAIAALALCLSPASAQAQQAPSETERLEQLGRLWIYFDLFSAHVSTSGVDWDQALVEALPAVRRARTEAQYVAALEALLARSGDPGATILSDDDEEQPAPAPPTRTDDGVAFGHCNTIAGTSDVGQALAQMNAAPRGAVLDCRDFGGSYTALQRLVGSIVRARTGDALPTGATLVRAYDGFPPEAGTSSGGYSGGLSLIQNPAIAPGAEPGEHPFVIMIDAEIASVLPQLAALQAAGRARITAESDIGAGFVFVDIGNGRQARMSRGVHVYPNGAIGFRADAVTPTDDDEAALSIAIAQLDAPLQTPAPQPIPVPSSRQLYVSDGGAPTVELRLLALYRLWGVIEYFFPYHDLTDRPWDTALAEFIPDFLAADTRAAYESAVLRLTARMQDTHASVGGLRTALYATARYRPHIHAIHVEGKLVVAGVYDPDLEDRIRPGDEIVAVDGVPVREIEARLTPLIAHSTPQSLQQRLAWWALGGARDSEARLALRGPDGRTRTERARRQRAQGPVSDGPVWRMLEGGVGYIDLVRLTREDADRALDELIEARALILDLRGYPQGTVWILAPRLARQDGAVAARFRRLSYPSPPDEPGETSTTFEQRLPPRGERSRYEGRVFVLIDERAISHAEHTGLFLEAAADVTFVGSPTTGANGDITSFWLPGGLGLTFTGHEVRWADGGQLQRIGLQPDVPVRPTIAGLAAGRDEVLQAALELAHSAAP